MKIYIASSFLNKENVRRVMDMFEKAGHTITYDWTIHEHTDDETVLRRESIKDAQGVHDSEVFVLLLPFRYGSASEFGAAIILGKLGIVIGIGEEREELKEHLLFAHHPNVIFVATPTDALDRLFWIDLMQKTHAETQAILSSQEREKYDL